MNQTKAYNLSISQKEIIKAILYFDVFQYPLTISEIMENSSINISETELNTELADLFHLGWLKNIDDYVLSPFSNANIIERRIRGNNEAKLILPKAHFYSKKIAKFPFIQGICISGGLSKNYYDKNGDIDYFVITKPNRLWISRTLFILFFKCLPKHKKKYYCLNYFISSSQLTIPDNNLFAATELGHLIPTVNYNLYKDVLEINQWYKIHLKNKDLRPSAHCIETPDPFYKKMIEMLFYGRVGDWIDSKLLHITLKHWRKKYSRMSDDDFNIQFRSQKHVCKRHESGFQKKVLKSWDEKKRAYENSFDITLE